MTRIINNGTIVTADLRNTSDIRIEDGKIAEIGENLSGGTCAGCDVLFHAVVEKAEIVG